MKISILIVVLVCSLLISRSTQEVVLATPKILSAAIQKNNFTLLYVFSSSCKYCSEFTPVFEKLSKNKAFIDTGIKFVKLDGNAYQEVKNKYQVYSYPTVLLFWKGIDYPIHFRKERSSQLLTQFLLSASKSNEDPNLLNFHPKMPYAEKFHNKIAILYAQEDSREHNLMKVLAQRDGYLIWARANPLNGTKVIFAQEEFTSFDMDTLQTQKQRVYARLHELSEESWLKIVQRKLFSVIYLNKHSSKKTKAIIAKIARNTPTVHFLQIDEQNEEWKPVLKHFGLNDEQNIVAVDQLYDAVFVMNGSYTQERITEFIHKAKQHEWPVYLKTEKADKPNKLTRENFQQRLSTNQDVLIFLYDKSHKSSKDLMSLFTFLLAKLQDNKNLFLLRCDVSANEVEDKLGMQMKPLPKLVYFRNRMKDQPIVFTGSSISAQTVIQFIMENTTFDFEDSWAEL